MSVLAIPSLHLRYTVIANSAARFFPMRYTTCLCASLTSKFDDVQRYDSAWLVIKPSGGMGLGVGLVGLWRIGEK